MAIENIYLIHVLLTLNLNSKKDTWIIHLLVWKANKFFQFLISVHNRLSFTLEEQVNSMLPFLGLSINKSAGKFTFSVIIKPTFTGLGFNFFSICPQIYKSNAIETFLHRPEISHLIIFCLHMSLIPLDLFIENNGYSIYLLKSLITIF